MDSYRTAEWKAFRNSIIRRDGDRCVKCLRSPADDGITLQVHHREYLPGRLPWQYPTILCETLCKGCHAVEHGLVRPSIGWDHLGFEDLGGLDGNCDLCGTPIRYVYLVDHPKWLPMEVGEICCDKLTSTAVATEHRQFLDRLTTFLRSTRWQTDSSGNQWIVRRGLRIGIVSTDEAFKINVAGVEGKLKFTSIDDAKIKAFELVWSGAIAAYLTKRRDRKKEEVSR